MTLTDVGEKLYDVHWYRYKQYHNVTDKTAHNIALFMLYMLTRDKIPQ